MHEHHAVAPKFVADLADCLEKRQPFDVADRAADFANHEIFAARIACNEVFDEIGHMRNHLHRAAEIIALALLREQRGIDAACGDIVGFFGVHVGEALVMAEIEIGLRAIFGDEHLAMLGGVHRSRIDVQIRIELAQTHREAAALQQCGERCRR